VSAAAMRLALVGAPNSGKTTLFNGLTGGLAKTANYAGTTVETRTARFETPAGAVVDLIDLPGIYGLEARSTDERVAVEAILGQRKDEPAPDALILVADAANLRTHLHTILQLKALGKPVIVALNMIDLAERDGMQIDFAKLSALLGVPVVPTRATRKAGREGLIAKIDEVLKSPPAAQAPSLSTDLRALQREARRIAGEAIVFEPAMNKLTRQVDAVLLHPVLGLLTLIAVLFVVFQSVFAWAQPLMKAIEAGFAWLQEWVTPYLTNDIARGFIVDGAINGVGSVVVFLPQIVILFAFILFLEASGYMARAAFLMDELMLRVGLNGRAFIPLLSSFACAIPGIMAARTIEEERDRITTIMVAPLMTCSARLPVFTLLISVFIPSTQIGLFNLQGLVLFGLYVAGVVSAVAVAFVLKRTATKGPSQPLIMELPTYKLPVWRDFFLGLTDKAWAFLKRAGTIIFGTTVVLWVLAYFPNNGAGLEDSYAGMIGKVLLPIFTPIGFNLEMVVALVPGMAAREAAVSVLGVIYSLGDVDETSTALQTTLAGQWSLPSALSFLAWYVYAPQCFATLATVRRETNSWKWTGFMFAYLIGLAYVASLATFWIATWCGLK
jgi:ferrous iron transport protein B